MAKTSIRKAGSWDGNDGSGERYMEFRIGTGEACCVKITRTALVYVMECADGNEVYSYFGGPEYTFRKLTDTEREEIVGTARRELRK